MPNDTLDYNYDLYYSMEHYGWLLVYTVNETKCLIKKQPETYKTSLLSHEYVIISHCTMCNLLSISQYPCWFNLSLRDKGF